MAEHPLKICLTSSEMSPLAKTGGLADVTAALSAYLHHQGHDIRVLIPLYSSIDTAALNITPVDFMQDLPMELGQYRFRYSIDTVSLPGNDLNIYLLRCPELYNRPSLYTAGEDEHLRFILLSRAAIEMCQRMGFTRIFSIAMTGTRPGVTVPAFLLCLGPVVSQHPHRADHS